MKNELQRYLKDGVGQGTLNNLLRGYVPAYFVPKTKSNGSGNWYLSNNIQWNDEIQQVFEEIAEIGNKFSKLKVLDNNQVKEIFRSHKWEVEWPVPGISPNDHKGRWKCDAYKDKVAVEVELSNRSQIFKDAFKFLIGEAMNKVEVGVIMIRRCRVGNKPYFGIVDSYAHPIYCTLPMLRLAFHGFPSSVKKHKTN